MTIFDDVLSLVPNEELGIGLHKIKILSKSTFGIDIVPIEWAFSATKGIKNISESFIYNGSFKTKNSICSCLSQMNFFLFFKGCKLAVRALKFRIKKL